MRTGFLVLKIYRTSCSSAVSLRSRLFPGKSQQAAWRHGRGDTPGTMKSQGWNVQFGWWEDGGSVFKSTRVGGRKWKEHGFPSGQEANHKENSFKTSPQAFIHPRTGNLEHRPTVPPRSSEDKGGGFLQNRASFLFQVYFLNERHLQPVQSSAPFVTGPILLM